MCWHVIDNFYNCIGECIVGKCCQDLLGLRLTCLKLQFDLNKRARGRFDKFKAGAIFLFDSDQEKSFVFFTFAKIDSLNGSGIYECRVSMWIQILVPV